MLLTEESRETRVTPVNLIVFIPVTKYCALYYTLFITHPLLQNILAYQRHVPNPKT